LSIGVPIFLSVSELKRDEENFSRKKKHPFCALFLPWQRFFRGFFRDRQMNDGFIKLSHSATNTEILVKICTVVSETDLLGGRP